MSICKLFSEAQLESLKQTKIHRIFEIFVIFLF